MTRPATDLEIDRADEIVPVIKIHFDFLLSIRRREKRFRRVHQSLIAARWIFAEFVKHHDHAGLHFFQKLGRTTRVNFPELCVDLFPRRLRPFFARLDVSIRKFRLAPDIGLLMSREQLVQPGR